MPLYERLPNQIQILLVAIGECIHATLKIPIIERGGMHTMWYIRIIPAAGLLLSGCASIISGTTQEMTFNTSPEGASCILERNGKQIGQITSPGTLVVKKTKHDIRVTCEKEGFEPAVHMVKSEIEGATWGNIVAGGGIGWAIDSASGADNEYEEYVNITLTRAGDVNVQEQGSPAPVESDSIIEEPSADDEEGECC